MILFNPITLVLSAAVALYFIARWLLIQSEPFLKHLQIYQVVRAQFLRPYAIVEGVVWPRYTNQLGNNLFQYAYARLRARYLGVRFRAGKLNQDVFHTDVAKLANGKEKAIGENANPFAKAAPFEFIDAECDYTGKNYFTPVRSALPEEMNARAATSVIGEEIKADGKFLSIEPNAFAQDFIFYEREQWLIRKWMCPSVDSHEKEALQADLMGVERDDTIVFHLRFAGKVEGIFADPTYHELPMKFYTDVLKQHGRCARAILVHDPKSRQAAADVAERLKRFSPSVKIIQQCASRVEDFMVMYRAKHLALSVSTFAWWAGFLGHKFKSTIYYPTHVEVAWYNPRRLKTWYNKLLPRDNKYVSVYYTTAGQSS